MNCKVCQHPERAVIDQLLRDDVPRHIIAERYGIGTATLYRHRSDHTDLPRRKRGFSGHKPCMICDHPDRDVINNMIREQLPLTDIVGRFGINRGKIEWHRRNHLGINVGRVICTVCRHEHRMEIDEMIVSGSQLIDIANLFGIGRHSIHRHRSHCLGLEPTHSQRCTVCFHAKRAEIERDLVKGISQLQISRKYNLGQSAVSRHNRNHLHAVLSQERDSVMAEIIAAEEAQRRAQSRLKTYLARPGVEAGTEAMAMIESARSVLDKRRREAAKESAWAEELAQQARDRCRAIEVALQDVERADTELAQRRVSREMAERRAKSGIGRN